MRGVLAWKLGSPASVLWGEGWPSSLTHRWPVPAFVWAIYKMLDQIISKAPPSCLSPLETQSQFTSVVSAVGLKGGWGTVSWGFARAQGMDAYTPMARACLCAVPPEKAPLSWRVGIFWFTAPRI